MRYPHAPRLALYRNGRLFGIDAAVLADDPSRIAVAYRPAASPHETPVTHHIPRAGGRYRREGIR